MTLGWNRYYPTNTCMKVLRFLAITLPQILVLLLIGGSLDLLGGWNHTDSAFSTLIILFLVNPIVTLLLLIVEIIKYRRSKRQGDTMSFFMPGFAIFLFIEALLTNVVILSQVRMHYLNN